LEKKISVFLSEGLKDEGLYRISGLALAIDELKDGFEKSTFCHRVFTV